MTVKGVLATALSHLGGIVCVEGRGGEHIVTGKSDGSLIAGQIVGIISTQGSTEGVIDGIVVGGALEHVMGIVLPRYDVDCDTAVGAGLLVEIVIPKAGRLYNVFIANPTSELDAGAPFKYAGTDGGLVTAGSSVVENVAAARAFRPIENTSTFCTVIWGPN